MLTNVCQRKDDRFEARITTADNHTQHILPGFGAQYSSEISQSSTHQFISNKAGFRTYIIIPQTALDKSCLGAVKFKLTLSAGIEEIGINTLFFIGKYAIIRDISFQEEAMGTYTEKQILQMCETAFLNIPAFYNAKCVNYRGICEDTNKIYTEVIAAFLVERITEFNDGFPGDFDFRKKSYQTLSHDESCHINPALIEDTIAKQLYLQCKNGYVLEHIGTVIDYQTPLEETTKKSAGKIDLLSVNHQMQTVYILELKKPNASKKETMLRCVLESYTYLKLTDKGKLLADFDLPNHYALKASPFVFHGDAQWQEMQEERPALKELMQILDSKPYYLSRKDGSYIVSEES